MCGGGGGGDGGAGKREKQRQARIRQGTYNINNIFTPFNEGFYANRRKAYQDFANPQLTGQYNDALRGLLSALQRSGIMQSSEGARRISKLQGDYDREKQGIVDRSYDLAAQERNNIENTRSGLIADLNVTSDPQSALMAADARRQVLSANPVYQGLGDLFTNTTAGLVDYQEARENQILRRSVANSIRPPTASTGSIRS